MARIAINDASVTYFLRRGAKRGQGGAAVGGKILRTGRHIEVAALEHVSLTLRDGDRVGLIGVNGSGKSTLLKLCSGALSAQGGSIDIEGKVSAQFSLGAGIKPPLTGRQNAELKCLYLGTPQRRIGERVEEVRELSGLGDYYELPVSSYSAGMRSRLVMAMMRLVRAEILIMDEWIGAADVSVNKTIAALQAELINGASILLLASHSNRVLHEWTNRLVWLHQGEIRMDGPTDEVLDVYLKWMEEREP